MASQIYGIAYNHYQSVDYKLHGSKSFQAELEAERELNKLYRELDKLEHIDFRKRTDEQDARIDELYNILVS